MSYRRFTETPGWQKAYALVPAVYRDSSRFPKAEHRALTSQMGRAVVSVSSNMAEAFGCQHNRDRTNFYYSSRGSLYELEVARP